VPEGPELKHSRDRLRQIVLNKYITRLLASPSGRYKTKMPEGLSKISKDLPLKVESIDTKGKFMWWTLCGATDTWYLWSTYGMSGQWSRTAGDHVGFIVEYNDCAQLVTQDQQKVFFNDQRRFGTIKFVNNPFEHKKKLASLGPDILGDPLVCSEIFTKRILLKPNRIISEALMDQSCVSGVGNYLRAEALYDCGIDPWRCVADITSEEYVKLYESTVRIAKESYESHGATIRTYRSVDGRTGESQFYFKVYGQSTCPSGHETIRRQDSNGRTMHWCTSCQS